MDSLETVKKANAATNEAFKDDIVAQALIEEYVLKLFSYADAEDRAERFNKNVIKVSRAAWWLELQASFHLFLPLRCFYFFHLSFFSSFSPCQAFYTAGMLMDILTQFSELSDEIHHKRKYAKWKAAHIHACLKNGEKPHAGPVGWEDEEEEGGASAADEGSSGKVVGLARGPNVVIQMNQYDANGLFFSKTACGTDMNGKMRLRSAIEKNIDLGSWH